MKARLIELGAILAVVGAIVFSYAYQHRSIDNVGLLNKENLRLLNYYIEDIDDSIIVKYETYRDTTDGTLIEVKRTINVNNQE